MSFITNPIATIMQVNETQRQNNADLYELQKQQEATGQIAAGDLGIMQYEMQAGKQLAAADLANTYAGIVDASKKNQYNSVATAIQGTLGVGNVGAKQGYSGVRGVSSAGALSQQESFAQMALDEQIRSGNAQIENARMGYDYKALQSQLQEQRSMMGISQKNLETSILTGEYQRKISRLQEDILYNRRMAPWAIGLAGVNGLMATGTTVATLALSGGA